MAYSKTVYTDNTTPAISASNLNKSEQGIYDAHVVVDNVKGALNVNPLIDHLYNTWEIGSVNVSNNALVYYDSTTNVMRTTKNTFVTLYAGDIIWLDGVKSRIIKVVNNIATLVENAASGSYTISETGTYVLTVYYSDTSAITNTYDLMTRFSILRANGLLANQENKTNVKISAINNQEYYKITNDLFELGTAYVNGNSITYTSANNAIRIKQGSTIHLYAGDVIEADSSVQYRLIKTGTPPTTIYNYDNPPKYTVATEGDYVIVVKYTNSATVSDISALLLLFGIIQSSSHLKTKIDSIEAQLGGDNDLVISNNHHNYTLNKNNFEIGTAYVSSNKLSYVSATTVIRPIAHTFIELNAGDIVVPKDNTKYRTIYVSDSTTSPETAQTISVYGDYINVPYVIETTGKYVFVIQYSDGRTVTDINDLLSKFEIIKYDSDFLSLPIPKEDNSSKGCFAIMTYNVGQWWNGSSAIAADSKFSTLYDLQKSILSLYNADIICLQEYTDRLTANNSALALLINPMYANLGRFAPNLITAGKLIGANKKLSGATNVIFTNNDGASRNYEKAYIWLNGRKVCIISTHLSLDANIVALQCDELLTAVQNEPYFIICMDSNVDNSNHESTLYQNTMKKFSDAGYRLANDGSLITYEDGGTALDQIIVSANINIKSALIDLQKYGFADGSDHYPLIAYVEVY